uniref:Uncharacterized protein n=1 Tax=Anguilla anguilla TaxID=7936 RepID=A0A0E9WKG5_ANGAN
MLDVHMTGEEAGDPTTVKTSLHRTLYRTDQALSGFI